MKSLIEIDRRSEYQNTMIPNRVLAQEGRKGRKEADNELVVAIMVDKTESYNLKYEENLICDKRH